MTKLSFLPVVLIPSCILLIPGAAMLLNAEGWRWSGADFIVAWIVIAAAVLAYRFVASRATTRAYRFAAGIAVLAGLILVWINGAVGIIGSEANPANGMYAGVLIVGAVGAAIARLRPAGMARALGITALAQFLVPLIALLVWPTDFSPGVAQVCGLNFIFVLMFGASALLFRSAAGDPPRSSAMLSTA